MPTNAGEKPTKMRTPIINSMNDLRSDLKIHEIIRII